MKSHLREVSGKQKNRILWGSSVNHFHAPLVSLQRNSIGYFRWCLGDVLESLQRNSIRCFRWCSNMFWARSPPPRFSITTLIFNFRSSIYHKTVAPWLNPSVISNYMLNYILNYISSYILNYILLFKTLANQFPF